MHFHLYLWTHKRRGYNNVNKEVPQLVPLLLNRTNARAPAAVSPPAMRQQHTKMRLRKLLSNLEIAVVIVTEAIAGVVAALRV